MSFTYRRRPHFYETDAMGIIHHASYLHYLEEARVAYLRSHDLFTAQPLSQVNYPVLQAQLEYKNPLFYEDEVEIELSLKIEKIRLFFDYTLHTKRFSQPVAFGKTVHVAMDMATRRPIRLPQELTDLVSSN